MFELLIAYLARNDVLSVEELIVVGVLLALLLA